MAASVNPSTTTPHRKSRTVTENQRAKRRMRTLAHSRVPASHYTATGTGSIAHRHHHYYERFHTSSFASDITEGDVTAGEDPVVRQAAIDALGNMNGTVVAIEPTSGRILAMVNQKLALRAARSPARPSNFRSRWRHSSEGVIDKETEVSLGGRSRMNLTTALAHSNNAYFEASAANWDSKKCSYYAHQFGLGELAGYHIPGEQLGTYPEEEIPPKLGGVGKMCSFGEGISMTPLQLGALVSAIANGGTLYYLQHPTSPDEVANFQPRIKRHLDIAP